MVFISNALNPAQVLDVIFEPNQRACTVVVPDFQLSLAIGKRGQNARLAAKLTGYKIDIKPESEWEKIAAENEEELLEEVLEANEELVVEDVLDEAVEEISEETTSEESTENATEDIVVTVEEDEE